MAKFANRLLLAASCMISGCAVHYYDTETGAEHIYGFGHLVMQAKPPRQGRLAVVRGTDLLGLGFGNNEEGGYFSLGWDSRRRIDIVDRDTAIELLWPDGDFLHTRVGAPFPDTVTADPTREESLQ